MSEFLIGIEKPTNVKPDLGMKSIQNYIIIQLNF